MLAIPTLKFSYGNLLLARLRELGSASIEDLLGEDPARRFKSEGPFENPEGGPVTAFGSRGCSI